MMEHEEKRMTPTIRFRGFTDAWKQRKLGDLVVQRNNYINPQLTEIELWSLTVECGLTPKTDRYNRKFLVKKEDNFKEVNPKSILYNLNFAPLKRRKTPIKSREIQPFSFALCTILSDFQPDCR